MASKIHYTPEVRARISSKASLRRHTAASKAQMSAERRARAAAKRGPAYATAKEYRTAKRQQRTNRGPNAEILDFQRHIHENVLVDSVTGCWVWQKSKNKLGYGFQRYKGKSNQLAHRVAYQEFVGPIPDGLNVLHRCDNPPCCNPAHLFLGTQKDNIQDMVAKGRYARIGAANKGSRFFNNGIDQLKLKAGVEPPEGYIRGRLPGLLKGHVKLNPPRGEIRAALNRLMNTGKYWATNGQRNIRVLKGQPPPEGFRPGMRRKRAVS